MDWSFEVLGGGQEIGANSYLLKMDGVALLLEAGLHPKKFGQESLPDYERLGEDLEAIFISHAHLDHVGSLPLIHQRYPEAPIFATPPTKDIALRMLHNTVTVMNIFREEKGLLEYPFFEHEDLRPLKGGIIDLEFQAISRKFPKGRKGGYEKVRLRRNIRAHFLPSGHVLGAGGLIIHQGKRTIYYTGDISFQDQALLAGAEIPLENINVLILECTYANDPFYYAQNRPEEINKFAQEVSQIINQKGCVLIPAFALGKTQELMAIIYSLMRQSRIPPVPLFLSGLGRSITEIYQEYRRYLRPHVSISDFDLFSVLEYADELYLKYLLREPCIIVATNGMMVENTPSARIARLMVQDERHGIFFCGFIDPETLGYKLFQAQIGEELVFTTDSEPVKISNPNIKRFFLSSHADRYELLDLAQKLAPQIIILIHGEQEGMAYLQQELSAISQVYAGERGKTIFLD